MDNSSIRKIKAIAPALKKFFELDAAEREWLFPLLSKSVQSTIKLIELIQEAKTYDEIAQELGVNFSTVKQKILALKSGGFNIQSDEKASVFNNGRPRKLNKANHD